MAFSIVVLAASVFPMLPYDRFLFRIWENKHFLHIYRLSVMEQLCDV